MLDLYNEKLNLKTSSNTDLINYIVKRHHTSLEGELMSLSDRILRLYEVYFDLDGEFLGEIHKIFNDLKTNFEAHIIKEEKMLFINIKDYENNKSEELLDKITRGIESVDKNNNEIEYSLKELRRVTHDYTYGTVGHTGYDKLYRSLKELEKETEEHLELERDFIFRRIKEESI